jgi:hypothetical protein
MQSEKGARKASRVCFDMTPSSVEIYQLEPSVIHHHLITVEPQYRN